MKQKIWLTLIGECYMQEHKNKLMLVRKNKPKHLDSRLMNKKRRRYQLNETMNDSKWIAGIQVDRWNLFFVLGSN